MVMIMYGKRDEQNTEGEIMKERNKGRRERLKRRM